MDIYKPFVISVKEALEKNIVAYDTKGIILFSPPGQTTQYQIDLSHQYPLIRPTFEDLNKALSSTANSPLFTDNKSLRQKFEEAYAEYEEAVEKQQVMGLWEPLYGTYVFDYVTRNMYVIAPEFWHRLGLVTNNSKLMTDPKGKFSWQQIRERFDNAVVGVVGASVGGNIFEGVMREIRPKQAKIADHDSIEITNLNRFERGSIHYLGASKAERMDNKDSYDIRRISKVAVTAYEHSMVDPYAQLYTYPEGIHEENITQFLLGNGKEPKLDILVEECDDLRLKIELRKLCRTHKIPLLMLSDWGHMVEGQFFDFAHGETPSLGYNVSDKEIDRLLNRAMKSGKREDRFDFVKALCGPELARDEFGLWMEGKGEQPTSSLPQSGATAMTSGGIGGKVLALHFLGYMLPARFLYDLKHFTVIQNKNSFS